MTLLYHIKIRVVTSKVRSTVIFQHLELRCPFLNDVCKEYNKLKAIPTDTKHKL